MKRKIGVVYSLGDPAGAGMAEHLKPRLEKDPIEGIEIRGFEESVLYFDFLEERFPSDYYVVLSKHKSESGIPSLTVHHTGNLTGDNRYGGKPYELSWSFPRLAGHILRILWSRAQKIGLQSQYEIAYEVTHHGPTSLRVPLVFFEIGSTPDRWTDKRIQEFMAETIYEALETFVSKNPTECLRTVGFGGGHYARRFTKMTIEGKYCFGHMVPRYVIREGIDQKVLVQVFRKNHEGVTHVVFEKKSARKNIREMVREKSLEEGLEFTFI